MKILIVNLFVVGYISASATVEVIKQYNFQNDGSGNYSFEFATGDKEDINTNFIHKQEGHLKKGDIQSVEGSFMYKLDDSLRLSVHYSADERGYRPKVSWMFKPVETEEVKYFAEFAPSAPGGPGERKGISPTLLGTLVGGNGK